MPGGAKEIVMRVLSVSFVCLTVLASTVACGVTVESTWRDNGINMAAFDLQCPAEKITMTVLTRNGGLGCSGSKVGVRGCGKQTQYECHGEWHRSAEVSSIDK
jgi:hypothetical protein